MVVTLTIEATDGGARAGWLATPHGRVATPMFMPVGTRAAVKTLDAADLAALGAGCVLANAYHLMLRPGAETVAALGGVHGMSRWPGPMLTDSGGFQIFSIEGRVHADGVRVRSVYDGSWLDLTPEEVVRVQGLLGADIAMALDHCLALPAAEEAVRAAVDRTYAWAERSRIAHAAAGLGTRQALFGIVQGGADPAARERAAADLVGLDFPGYGIGGLSVGESKAEMAVALAAAVGALPADRPRYLMGVGDLEGLVDGVATGVDMFDCVLPTRLGRHARVLTTSGHYSLKRAEHAGDIRPLVEGCDCAACAAGYSRGTLRHLLALGEPTGARLVSIHNLRTVTRLMGDIREAIAAQRFDDFRAAFHDARIRPPAALPRGRLG